MIPEFTTSLIDTGFTPEDDETKKLYKEVAAFARQGQPIIIFGPTGAGKEFLARHYYNTLITAEFYQQYKDNWSTAFDELIQEYSSHYDKDEIETFVKSLRAGVFHSINSANIYPDLADSILFGTEKGSYTDAITRPGLLESLKCGVLFMDEIGELPKYVQAKLLRAVDSEIAEGCRVSGKMIYHLRDLIVISATNQPHEKIRKDFYYKLGIEVNLKGIDERPRDVRKSIPHFIRKAIGKRKDYGAINGMFSISGITHPSQLSETEEIIKFSKDQADLITDDVLNRKWPGNFRALRTTLEASVLRIESPKDPLSFSDEFRKNLKYYMKHYSEDSKQTYLPTLKLPSNTVFPSNYPDMDRRILDRINSKGRFQDMSDLEKKILAVFLSSTHETGFRRRDLEEYYKSFSGIRHSSEAHIRNKIGKLLALDFLKRSGEGKSTRYHLTQSFLVKVTGDNVFALPEADKNWADRRDEINNLTKHLYASERIYINGSPGYGKSAFIAIFCQAIKQMYNLYYYELGREGITKLFKDIFTFIKSKNKPDLDETLEDPVKNIQPYLGQVFKLKNNNKPVLILDNAHFISESDHMSILNDMANEWREVIIILVGDNMDNTLPGDFTPFSLNPWNKPV
jgi:transcriptional regulator of acetoin/glycerol metabolism